MLRTNATSMRTPISTSPSSIVVDLHLDGGTRWNRSGDTGSQNLSDPRSPLVSRTFLRACRIAAATCSDFMMAFDAVSALRIPRRLSADRRTRPVSDSVMGGAELVGSPWTPFGSPRCGQRQDDGLHPPHRPDQVSRRHAANLDPVGGTESSSCWTANLTRATSPRSLESQNAEREVWWPGANRRWETRSVDEQPITHGFTYLHCDRVPRVSRTFLWPGSWLNKDSDHHGVLACMDDGPDLLVHG